MISLTIFLHCCVFFRQGEPPFISSHYTQPYLLIFVNHFSLNFHFQTAFYAKFVVDDSLATIISSLIKGSPTPLERLSFAPNAHSRRFTFTTFVDTSRFDISAVGPPSFPVVPSPHPKRKRRLNIGRRRPLQPPKNANSSRKIFT